MNRIAKTLTALCLLLSLTAVARADGPGMSIKYDVLVSGSAFTTQAMDTSKTTDGIIVRGLTFLRFGINHTVNDSATDIRMTCQESDDNTTWRDIQVLSPVPSTGIATSVPMIWLQAVGAAENWAWSVAVLGYVYMRCTFSATSGVSADKLTVTARGGGLQ